MGYVPRYFGKQSLECAMSQHTKKAHRNFFIKQIDSGTWQIVMFIPCPYCFWVCSLCSLTRSQHLSIKHFIDRHFWPNFAATRLCGICTALQQQQDEILRVTKWEPGAWYPEIPFTFCWGNVDWRVETKPSGVWNRGWLVTRPFFYGFSESPYKCVA